jgi:hypothetical protein
MDLQGDCIGRYLKKNLVNWIEIIGSGGGKMGIISQLQKYLFLKLCKAEFRKLIGIGVMWAILKKQRENYYRF